ncbi:hypothetical protein CcCBS67573_g07187 [Chytriomyces confervae]|uniref:Trafficking protein particle complex subunit 6B n=1 Tax=Chytriomyces confervae TaxID=246404 RepID=A0A507EYI0_9FUNG|nr:hypothetical protein CcCBS67573_g07187 [Chytriomyces confervae]
MTLFSKTIASIAGFTTGVLSTAAVAVGSAALLTSCAVLSVPIVVVGLTSGVAAGVAAGIAIDQTLDPPPNIIIEKDCNGRWPDDSFSDTPSVPSNLQCVGHPRRGWFDFGVMAADVFPTASKHQRNVLAVMIRLWVWEGDPCGSQRTLIGFNRSEGHQGTGRLSEANDIARHGYRIDLQGHFYDDGNDMRYANVQVQIGNHSYGMVLIPVGIQIPAHAIRSALMRSVEAGVRVVINPLRSNNNRFVCDSGMDFLLMEAVSLMQEGFHSIEEERDAAYLRMEQLGHRVGMGLAERATRDRPRFADNLEIVKFICKDFWLLLFNKQIDNLKTNHRGVYVLTDSSFKWFSRMSADVAAETPQLALVHSAFPCGLIRGALSSLGVSSSVVAEVAAVPQCTFQIKFR